VYQGIPGIPIFKGNINLYGNKKAIYFAVLVIIDFQKSGPPKESNPNLRPIGPGFGFFVYLDDIKDE
jgi:hypothetical protein